MHAITRYIGTAWGRTRLPQGARWPGGQHMRLDHGGTGESQLPQGHTCFLHAADCLRAGQASPPPLALLPVLLLLLFAVAGSPSAAGGDGESSAAARLLTGIAESDAILINIEAEPRSSVTHMLHVVRIFILAWPARWATEDPPELFFDHDILQLYLLTV